LLNGDVEYIYFTVYYIHSHVMTIMTRPGGGAAQDALELYLAGAAARLP
jgi:hypothetical protein